MNHELIKHELFQVSGKALLFNKDKSKIILLRRKDERTGVDWIGELMRGVEE